MQQTQCHCRNSAVSSTVEYSLELAVSGGSRRESTAVQNAVCTRDSLSFDVANLRKRVSKRLYSQDGEGRGQYLLDGGGGEDLNETKCQEGSDKTIVL